MGILRFIGTMFAVVALATPLQECDIAEPPIEEPSNAPARCIEELADLINPDNADPGTAAAFIAGNSIDADQECTSYQVMLLDGGRLRCGGTLIADEWVLTAGHCIASLPTPTVILGAYDISGADGEEYGVVETIIHPEMMNINVRGWWYKDAALIKLDRPADPTYIRPLIPTAAIDAELTTPGSRIKPSGWGRTRINGPLPDVLQQSVAQVTDDPTLCFGKDRDVQLCTDDSLGSNTCKGDSGGPHVSTTNNQIYLLGLTSIDGGCSQFTGTVRLASISDWITEHTGVEPTGVEPADIEPVD